MGIIYDETSFVEEEKLDHELATFGLTQEPDDTLATSSGVSTESLEKVNLGNLALLTEELRTKANNTELVLGRSKSSDLIIPTVFEKASKRHCTIIKNDNGTFTVTDGVDGVPSSNGTFYLNTDGEKVRIEASKTLPAGAILVLAEDITMQLPPLELPRLVAGQELTVGRSSTADMQIGGDKSISKNHFSLICTENGALYVRDLGTTNGTCLFESALKSTQVGTEWVKVKAGQLLKVGNTYLEVKASTELAQIKDQARPHGWNRTVLAEDRLVNSGKAERYEDRPIHYQGRALIGRDTRIDGGVYIGSGVREAIVVDIKKDPALREAYESAKSTIESKRFFLFPKTPEQKLHDVYKLVKELMPKEGRDSVDGVHELLAEENLLDDNKVLLGFFISHGEGVCRHRALLAGAIIEKLIDDGLISGRVSVDRNTSKRRAHAFVRFEDQDGNPTIIDPMHDYVGPPSSKDRATWDYRRPDEQ